MRRYLGVVGLSLLLVFVLAGVEKLERRTDDETAQSFPQQGQQYDNLYDLVYVSEEIDGLHFETGALHNEEKDVYYLFLPWWLEESESLTVYAAQDLVWNDCAVSVGETFELKPESQEVILQKDGNPAHLYVFFSSRIPTLWMETDGNVMMEVHTDKEYVADIQMSFWDGTGKSVKIIDGMEGTLHCRGNASFARTSKKSYLLETDQAVEFMGLGKNEKWVLTSNSFDETMLRNYLTFQIAQRVDLEFTPEAEFVDLYVDGKYFGLYLIGDKVECGPDRVEIEDLEKENEEENGEELLKRYPYVEETKKGFRAKSPQDISGGYLLELDLQERWEEEVSGFISQKGQPVVIHEPKHATVNEVDYISDLYQQLEDALQEEANSRTYERYIDVESFALKYIIEELSKNRDANITSQYLYKDTDLIDTKFFAGPVWDYDRSWGNGGPRNDGIDLSTPVEFYAKGYQDPHPFWAWLCEKESFYKVVKELYRDRITPVLEGILKTDELGEWREKIAASVEMDGRRWEREYLEDRGTEPDYDMAYQNFYDFIIERKAFLDQEWCE